MQYRTCCRVIVFATEMQPADYPILEKINKPIVLYDYEAPDGKYNSVASTMKAR